MMLEEETDYLLDLLLDINNYLRSSFTKLHFLIAYC
jgi:hypothetical protein